MTLGRKIAALREKRGLSQKQLGELLGSEGHAAELRIQRLERGRAELKFKDLVKLLNIFEITFNDFLRNVDLD